MRKSLTLSLILAVALSAGAAAQQPLEGYWRGAVTVQGQQLELCFDVLAAADGSLSATMDVPQQNASGIKVETFACDGLNVRADITAIGAKFEGINLKDIISGNFSQSGLTLPLTLRKQQRPQEPREPFPYAAEDVVFDNATDGVRLAGTLTRPAGGSAAPAVVLVTGSGAQDRDERLMGHRPFAVIADHLTRQGIAVLRYDDRGVGGSDAGPAGATTLDLSRDAAAAVAWLRSQGYEHVGVCGHSEGGSIAYILGSQGLVDFVVSLAGPTVSGAQVLDAQRRALYEASGLPQEAIEANAALFAGLDEIIARHETPDEARPEILTALAELQPAERAQVVEQLLSPWMYWFNRHDPTDDILAVRCPVLALNGSKDLQVLPDQNLARLEALRQQCPELNVTAREMPELNHLFQHCTTGLPAEYGIIEETISPDVLSAISEFINQLDK